MADRPLDPSSPQAAVNVRLRLRHVELHRGVEDAVMHARADLDAAYEGVRLALGEIDARRAVVSPAARAGALEALRAITRLTDRLSELMRLAATDREES